jgi:hypothetical protein
MAETCRTPGGAASTNAMATGAEVRHSNSVSDVWDRVFLLGQKKLYIGAQNSKSIEN